jgi:hypothetical protein
VRIVTALLIATVCFADERAGLRPRPSRDDYTARAGNKQLTVAAALLSNEQVNNAFATELAGNYIVIEVAVYPEKEGSLDLRQDDFVLRIGRSRTLVRPVDARTIAARLHRKAASQASPNSPSDIMLYPTVGVAVGSGPSFPDGTRRTGVSTGVGIGVGVGSPVPGNPPPASTDADRETMQLELSEKGLPEQKITTPVAGYLYFPMTATRKREAGESHELEYFGAKSKLSMRLPAAREK